PPTSLTAPFYFSSTATSASAISTLSLHDALPIYKSQKFGRSPAGARCPDGKTFISSEMCAGRASYLSGGDSYPARDRECQTWLLRLSPGEARLGSRASWVVLPY